jgi:hypothetical protein
MDVDATADGMHDWHDGSLCISSNGDDGEGGEALAVDRLFPRVIDNARLVGVPQAGRTDSFPGGHPYKHATSSARRPCSLVIRHNPWDCRPFHAVRMSIANRHGGLI